MEGAPYQPSAESLDFRARLARLTPALRPIRSTVTFGKLPAHTVPTLALFRALIRHAPTENIRVRVGMLFRRNRGITVPSLAKDKLVRGYKWLELFKRANEGDEHMRKVMERYSRFIEFKRNEAYFDKLAEAELRWQKKLASRPIVTGGYIRPTAYNPPLPRLKPQPIAISKMFRRRLRQHTIRINSMNGTKEMINHLRIEAQFEHGLKKMHPSANIPSVFSGDAHEEWVQPFKQKIAKLNEYHEREIKRANMPFSPELLAQIKDARRNKIENKTRENERERRGEILKRTIKRMRGSPPAHVLVRMTPEQKRMDRIARSVSEVGYVAQAKRKLGFKLRDPEAWKKELSLDKKDELDKMARKIRRENRKRTLELGAKDSGGGSVP